jgi:Family of unknown function (DUF6062)
LSEPLPRARAAPRRDADPARPHSGPRAVARVGPVLTEFEHLLADGGCPVCAHVMEAERSFFAWFEIEYHTSASVQTQLRAGMGMCAVHARRLVEERGGGPIMTIVMREALYGALQGLGDGQPGRSCLACDAAANGSNHANQSLAVALHDAGNASLYREHVGECLPHMLQAAATAEPSILRLLAERLLASLADCEGTLLGEILAGADLDARRRAHWRARLPDDEARNSTVAALCQRLTTEACPVCLAGGLTERRYLEWFVDRTREQDASLGTDPGEFCSEHLHDLRLADRAAADFAAGRKRAATISDLERVLDQIRELPPPVRRRRRGGADGRDRVRAVTSSPHPCPVCHARVATERRQLELLTAALALAPVRRQYETCHGLCVRHAAGVGTGASAQLVRRHAEARVAVLAWEVQEGARKYAWAFRHEPSGPEQDAWLRGLAQIDGRVFTGGPAPSDLATTTPERP